MNRLLPASLLWLWACTPPSDSAAKATSTDSAAEDDTSSAPATYTLTPWAACEAPAPALHYTEVGAAWGLRDTTDDEHLPNSGSAAGLVDVDGDGDDDVLLAKRHDSLTLQRAEGGRLGAEEVLLEGHWSALSVVDWEGDGDLDLVAGGESGAIVLLQNDGHGTFTDITAGTGLDTLAIQGNLRALSWADIDRDGDLDVYVQPAKGMDNTPSFLQRLLRNDGAGHLEDVSAWIPEESRTGLVWQSLWLDANLDGWPDLFVSNDLQNEATLSQMLLSEGLQGDGRVPFTNFTDDCYCDTVNAMGLSTGDIDNSGTLDLFVTSTGPNGLYLSMGDGTFLDASAPRNAFVYTTLGVMGLGSALYDADLDGWLDLIVAGGRLAGDDVMLENQDPVQPDVFLFGGPSYFSTGDVGLVGLGDNRGVSFGFLDADGTPELLISGIGGPSQLYQASCLARPSLAVELRAQGQNRFGIGARVVLTTTAGTQTREIGATLGYLGEATPRAVFGWGDATPRSLQITWPTGESQTIPLDATAAGRMVVEQ